MTRFLLLFFQLAPLSLVGSEYIILSTHDEPYSNITIISDQIGNKFVVKQVKQETLKEQFLLVMDCLAAHMAEEFGIRCNKVSLIPGGVQHCGKQLPHLPATLHTFAVGIMLNDHDGPFSNLDIQQRYRAIGSWVWQKQGMLKVSWKGLTRLTIEHMAMHPQLPSLVAFDTFIGNNDRGAPNLFYDEITDSFYGIDMGNAYGQNLCKEAVCSLLRLHHDTYQFNAEELDALQVYKETLNQLIALYPPKKLHALLDDLAGRAHYNDLTDDQLDYDKRLQFYKDMITESYHDAITLSTLLEMLLGKQQIIS